MSLSRPSFADASAAAMLGVGWQGTIEALLLNDTYTWNPSLPEIPPAPIATVPLTNIRVVNNVARADNPFVEGVTAGQIVTQILFVVNGVPYVCIHDGTVLPFTTVDGGFWIIWNDGVFYL